MSVEFIPAPIDGGRYELEDIYKLVASHADRLGVSRDTAFENAMLFADTVGTLENEGKLEGANRPQKGKERSSAKGLYQFLSSSVGPAKKRLGRHIDISDYPDDPNEMTWNQQTLLFLADVLEKTAVVDGKKVPGLGDELMRPVLETGDMESVKNAYYTLHHTNPDAKTIAMTERKLSEDRI